MNWVLCVVLGIFAIFGLIGLRKGLIRIVFSFLILVACILAMIFLAPAVEKTLKEKTNWYTSLNTAIYHTMEKNETVNTAVSSSIDSSVADSALSDQTIAEQMGMQTDTSSGDVETVENEETANGIQSYVNAVIDNLKLPGSMTSELQGTNTQSQIHSLVTNTGNTVKEMVLLVIAQKLADIIFHILVYSGVFLLVFLILKLIFRVTNFAFKMPVLGQINRVGGLLLGLAEGLVVVWIFMLLITAESGLNETSSALLDINGNAFLNFIYNHNLIWVLVFGKSQ